MVYLGEDSQGLGLGLLGRSMAMMVVFVVSFVGQGKDLLGEDLLSVSWVAVVDCAMRRLEGRVCIWKSVPRRCWLLSPTCAEE